MPSQDSKSHSSAAPEKSVQEHAEGKRQVEFDEHYFSASDGLKLYARVYGDPTLDASATPVVCLPGLTRNSADFHPLALLLSSSEQAARRVICFDSRGRGLSAWDSDPKNYNIQVETDDVLAGCAALGVKHAVFIGTSRGALLIHALAAIRPGMLVAAVLNDAGPVVDGAGLAKIMAYQERLAKVSSLDEAVAKLKEIQGKAFTALRDEDWLDYVRPMFAEKNGALVTNSDPAITAALQGIDLSIPLPTLWPQFDGLRNVPLMTIRGENSSLLSEETVAEMARRHPRMETIVAKGQGHAPVLHLEPLADRIAVFASATDQR